MEQQQLASAPPTPSLRHDRCAYTSPTGRRCRANSADPLHGLCQKHAARKDTDPDSADLSADLFGEGTPSFEPLEEINFVLTNLVVLVAQGRISSRRAGVITYGLSFILRGVQAIDRKAADTPTEIICDIDSAVARRAQALAQTEDPTHDEVLQRR